jgi:hypothetical protein
MSDVTGWSVKFTSETITVEDPQFRKREHQIELYSAGGLPATPELQKYLAARIGVKKFACCIIRDIRVKRI